MTISQAPRKLQAAPESCTSPSPSSTRLYVSPLSAESLPVVLQSVHQQSLLTPPYFGVPQTFPEKPFAYLELPGEIADKLRKKLNGSIFKGTKLRVEEARCERGANMSTRKRKADVFAESTNYGAAASKTRRGRKPENGVLRGQELPPGRRVKRGWEEGWVGADLPRIKRNAGKPQTQNQDTGGATGETKMVFRTSLPPNRSESLDEDGVAQSKAHKKTHKTKSGIGVTEVKEFEKTEKVPTFLRESSKILKDMQPKFDDEKGWTDENGNVIEEVKSHKRGSRDRRKKNMDCTNSGQVEGDAATAPNAYSADAHTGDLGTISEKLQVNEDLMPQIAVDTTAAVDNNTDCLENVDARAVDETLTKEPSQLETLFKRPAPSDKSRQSDRPTPIQTFSFFGGGDETGDNSTPDPDVPIESENSSSTKSSLRKRRLASLQIPPQTPFTRRDLDARGMRSAAPTPDTAAIGKRMKVPWMRRSQTRSISRERDSRSTSGPPNDLSSVFRETIEEQDEAAPSLGEKVESVEGSNADPQKLDVEIGSKDVRKPTEFEKQFYEQRGDLNRSWKAQRRDARKSARQAQNRHGRSG